MRAGTIRRLLFASSTLLASAGVGFAQGGPVMPGEPLEGMLPGYEGSPSDSWNTELVGWVTMQARSTYKGMVMRQGDRYILYAGQHAGEHFNPMTGEVEPNGFSVVDVTDPANPVFLKHVPGLYANQARNLWACAGDVLPNGTPGEYYLLSEQGNSGHVLFDVTDPANPIFMYDIETDRDDVHKVYWHCETGIATLTSTYPGWHSRLTAFYDLSDPQDPQFIAVYGLPNSQPDANPEGYRMTQIHEALLHPAPEAERRGGQYGDYWVFLAYGTGSNGIWQVLDFEALVNAVNDGSYDPLNPTNEQLRIPLVSEHYLPHYWGSHTAIPLFDMGNPPGWDNRADAPATRNYIVSHSEETGNDCAGHSHDPTIVFDITDPEHPVGIGNYYAAKWDALRTGQDEAAIYSHHCDLGGSYGVHNSQWDFSPVYDRRIMWIAYRNAGVRAVDVRNPYNIQEIAFYTPATNEEGGLRNGKKAIQTNNIETDERGYVYLFDRAGNGVHIILPTGPAREIADFPAAPPS